MKSALKTFFTTIYIFLIPLLSIMFLELIAYIPRNTSFWNFIRIAPFYTGIYFWLSLRPDAFNLLSAFILGIISDILNGSTLGINVLTFLVLYLVSTQIFIYFNIKKFTYSWILFLLAIFITLIFKTIIVSFSYHTLRPLNYLALEFMLTFAIYPVCSRFYSWVEKKYIHLEERYE